MRFTIGKTSFHATDKCISCGLCKQICPTNTITMADGKPTWGNTCVQCTACIHRCPVQAIEWGKEGVLAPLLENLSNAALEMPVYLAYTRIRRK